MKKPICRLIGERVRARRNEVGITRQEMADKAMISTRYAAQLEGGVANISVILLERIADALDVTVVSLITRD